MICTDKFDSSVRQLFNKYIQACIDMCIYANIRIYLQHYHGQYFFN